MQTRPFVFVNMAMTADGKIDTVERRGARISGRADTARVDGLRADADAIMIGGRTLLAEDPRLTVRDRVLIESRTRAGRSAQPMKVGVVSRVTTDGASSISPDGAFLRDGGGAVVVFTTEQTDVDAVAALETAGARVYVSGTDRVDLGLALATIFDLGVECLMVEGGGTLVAALLEADLVDELQLSIAPMLFGGASAPTPVAGAGWNRDAAIDLELIGSHTSPDADVVLRYRIGEAVGP